MIVSYYTDTGRVRSENQDSLYTCELSFDSILCIVCDGMGGHNGGKKASTIAIDEISNHIKQNFHDGLSDQDAKKLLLDAIDKANFAIYSETFKDDSLAGMGTTAVVAIITGNKMYVANVGDSRLYLYAKGKMCQITNDHSLVGDLLAKGLITKKEAKNHPQKNVITRAVGTDDTVKVDIFETELAEGNIVLLCSDGLHTMVSEKEIAKILKEDIKTSSQKLVDLANENGGKDNISVIVVEIN